MVEYLLVYGLPFLLCVAVVEWQLGWKFTLYLIGIMCFPLIRSAGPINFKQWLVDAGCMYISPVAIVLLISKYQSESLLTSLVALPISEVLQTILKKKKLWVMPVVAALLFTLEACIALNVSIRWGVYYFISIAIVIILDNNAVAPARAARGSDRAPVRLGLSSFEMRAAFAIWGILLHNLVNYHYGDPSRVLPLSLTIYSMQQCLVVVEIFTTTILLTLCETETIVYSVQLTYDTVCNRNNPAHIASPLRYTLIRRIALAARSSINLAVTLLPRLNTIGITNFSLWLLRFLHRAGRYELSLCLYWVAMIVLFTVIAYYAAAVWRFPRTCNRKIFHFLVVLMFAPALQVCSKLLLLTNSKGQYYTERQALYSTGEYRILAFLVLALGVAVNIFILFEYIRLCLLRTTAQRTVAIERNSDTDTGAILSSNTSSSASASSIAQAGQQMEQYMQLFLPEARSAAIASVHVHTAAAAAPVRTVEMSHISLLLGCAMPIWLFAYIVAQQSDHTVSTVSVNNHNYVQTAPLWMQPEAPEIARMLILSIVPYVGLITLGIGDACAAIVGKLYGTHRWYCKSGENGSNTRTVEGSAACFVSMLCATSAVLYMQYCSIRALLLAGGDVVNATNKLEAFAFSPSAVALCGVLVVTLLLTTAAEAITTENDNILLPIYMIILLLSGSEVFL